VDGISSVLCPIHTKEMLQTFSFVFFSEDIVVVTGFGPFGHYTTNASWETVKLLPSMNIEEEFDVNLIIREIPVTYEYVAENVPALWRVHNPMVCILVVLEHTVKPITVF
jgi:pyroglutamyl-peptidase